MVSKIQWLSIAMQYSRCYCIRDQGDRGDQNWSATKAPELQHERVQPSGDREVLACQGLCNRNMGLKVCLKEQEKCQQRWCDNHSRDLTKTLSWSHYQYALLFHFETKAVGDLSPVTGTHGELLSCSAWGNGLLSLKRNGLLRQRCVQGKVDSHQFRQVRTVDVIPYVLRGDIFFFPDPKSLAIVYTSLCSRLTLQESNIALSHQPPPHAQSLLLNKSLDLF